MTTALGQTSEPVPPVQSTIGESQRPVRQKPAELLLGATLVDEWRVVERVSKGRDSTGGTFSIPYWVERATGGSAENSERAFCKALDLTFATEVAKGLQIGIVDALLLLTRSYTHERDLVVKCRDLRMKNVLHGLGAGEYTVDHPDVDPLWATVPYILLEPADGDVRTLMASDDSAFDSAVKLRVLHGAANGLRQLHQAGVFHQDLKPSNLMTVNRVGKLGDLGSATSLDGSNVWDSTDVAGDRTYAPPERLYGSNAGDEKLRRLACDCYHLGSMAVFFFCGSGLTPLLEAELGPGFNGRTWPRDYENVLPFVRGAFNRVLQRVELELPADCAQRLIALIRELCDPDPAARGHSGAGSGMRRYAMERYVSLFNLAATKLETRAGFRGGGS